MAAEGTEAFCDRLMVAYVRKDHPENGKRRALPNWWNYARLRQRVDQTNRL